MIRICQWLPICFTSTLLRHDQRLYHAGRSKKRKRDSSICSDVEQTFEKQEPEIAPSPPKKKKLKKVTPRAKIDSDEKDTVKDFSFSDSD